MARQTNPIDRFLAALEEGTVGGTDAFSEDARLEVTLPNWHVTRHGVAAISDRLARWYPQRGRFEAMRRQPLPTGELIELTFTFPHNGDDCTYHQAHIFETAGGRISELRIYCGGGWSPALRAEMAEANAEYGAARPG